MLYGTPEFDKLLKDIIRKEYRHPLYEDSEDHAEEMSWHFYGTKPTDLLERVRPREDEEVTNYRLENYEPTTKSAADKAVHIVSKIFNPNLYSIRWENPTGSALELKEYTLQYYPDYNSIVEWTKDVLLRKMLADPNGVVAVKLDFIPEKQTETPMPVLKVYGSENIYNLDNEHYLVLIDEEEEKYYTFEYYDANVYVKFTVWTPSEKKIVVEETERYQHNFGEIPVWKLRGMSEAKDNGEIIYKSFFSSALPYWNLSIIHESDLFGAYINHLHPIRTELSEQCNYRWKGTSPCRGGTIKHEDGEFECPSCNGTGYKSVQSPYGVYRYNKEKLDEFQGKFEPVSFVSVPTDATKMLEERVEKMKRMGMWAINMDIEDNVGENQSGVAKVIDRSAQYDTLYNIGSVIFDIHLTNSFYFINKYMFGVSDSAAGLNPDKNLPEISKPTQFDIQSTSEMIANFEVAKKSGLDRNFLQLKQMEIQTKDLSTNTELKTFSFMLLDLDPLPGLSNSEIDMNVSKGYNSKTDAIIHFNIKAFLERAIRENKGFIALDKEQKMIVLQGYANEFIAANKPVLDTTLIDQV